MTGIDSASPRLPALDLDSGGCALSVDLSVFSTEAVLRAAYKLTDRCHLFVEGESAAGGRLVVTFRVKATGADLTEVVGEFSNELIDQQIREQLAREAGPVREILVAQAFAEGNLLDPDREEGDFVADPKGIGRLRGRGPHASVEPGTGEPTGEPG